MSNGTLNDSKPFSELLTREAQIAKSQQKEKKVTPTLGSSTKIKSNIKIHPDAANEPFHPLGRSTTTLPPTETKSVRPATTQVTQPPVHPQEEKLQHSIDNCIDLYETFKCQHLISIGVSCEKDELDLYCEKSCGFCGKLLRYPDPFRYTFVTLGQFQY